MIAAVWLALAALFAYLSYDARQLSVEPGEIPYEAISGDASGGIAGLSRHEVEERKWWVVRFGERNFMGAHWFWIVAAVACLVGSIWSALA
jgi:hypothetical protein